MTSADVSIDDRLGFEEAGTSAGKATIVLIHGAFSSGSEWSLVVPSLSSRYHLLIPDLPGHGRSKAIRPFTLRRSAELLARLIQQRAINGRAHIMGMSLGAHVTLGLLDSDPDVVLDVFISGYNRFPGTNVANLARAMRFEQTIRSAAPKSLITWLMDGADIQETAPADATLMEEALAPLCVSIETWPRPWTARTLVVAAGKAGILPTSDPPEAAARLADIGRRGNATTVAYVHPLMRHPWNRQDPKLYAETAMQWFEHGGVPAGFVRLDDWSLS